jgi:hypothetical protein
VGQLSTQRISQPENSSLPVIRLCKLSVNVNGLFGLQRLSEVPGGREEES